MSDSGEILTEEAVSHLEEEFEDELEDEIEEASYEEEEAEEGALPSPDGEEGAAEEEAAASEGMREAAEGSGKGPRARGGLPNPLALLRALRPASIAAGARAQQQNLQRLVWRLEDGGVFAAKLAAKVAVKAVRPALVWLIVSRAAATIDASRDPRLRMLRRPRGERMDYYYSQLLGKDWRRQFEQDLVEAIKEVDEGLVTDDAVREKRRLAAIMLRRMEVEEWDKERMRHFYYGLYGMGPWYWDMEERLHNPFFTGARGWNGPIEAWVDENQVFPRDAPASALDGATAALAAVERARGRPLAPGAAEAAAARERLSGADEVLGGRLFSSAFDRVAVRAAVEEAEAAAAAAQ